VDVAAAALRPTGARASPSPVVAAELDANPGAAPIAWTKIDEAASGRVDARRRLIPRTTALLRSGENGDGDPDGGDPGTALTTRSRRNQRALASATRDHSRMRHDPHRTLIPCAGPLGVDAHPRPEARDLLDGICRILTSLRSNRRLPVSRASGVLAFRVDQPDLVGDLAVPSAGLPNLVRSPTLIALRRSSARSRSEPTCRRG